MSRARYVLVTSYDADTRDNRLNITAGERAKAEAEESVARAHDKALDLGAAIIERTADEVLLVLARRNCPACGKSLPGTIRRVPIHVDPSGAYCARSGNSWRNDDA